MSERKKTKENREREQQHNTNKKKRKKKTFVSFFSGFREGVDVGQKVRE